MNSLRGVYTIWYRDILRFWRDKITCLGLSFCLSCFYSCLAAASALAWDSLDLALISLSLCFPA